MARFSTRNVTGFRSDESFPTAIATRRLVVRGTAETLALMLLPRANARMTRTPESPSRVRSARRSSFACSSAKYGMHRAITHQNTPAMRGRGHQEDKPEPPVDHERGEHRARRKQRPADELADSERHGELDLVDVVCDARHERRGAKPVDLGVRKRVDVPVEGAPDIRSDALGRAARHLLTDKGEGDAHQRKQGEHGTVEQHGGQAVLANAPHRSCARPRAA